MKRAVDDDTGTGKRWGAAAVIRDYGGVAPLAMSLRVEVREAMRTYMQQERSERVGVLTVSPGAYWSPRRWPGERCATAVQALAQMQGAAVVVLGRGEGAGLVQEWYQQFSVPGLWRPWSIQGSRRCPLCAVGSTLWGGHGA